MKRIALLLGTSRVDGNTSSLVSDVSDKIGLTQFNLNNYAITPFDYGHKNINDDFVPLVQELLKFDHVIFASPVYWYTMCAEMKVFFDRISDLLHVKKELGRQFRSKTVSIISTGSSPEPERSFEDVFTSSFKYLGMNYQGMLYCFCPETFIAKDHQENIGKYIAGSLLIDKVI